MEECANCSASVDGDDDRPGPSARQGPLSALSINGVVVATSPPRPPPLLPPPPASAREFLLSRPRGAYTALSISSSGCAQFWQEHCERLAATLVILSEGEREGEREERAGEREEQLPPFPLFREWHASSERAVPLPLASLVGDALLPGVRAAVASVRDLQRAGAGKEEAEVSAAAAAAAAGAATGEKEKDTAPASSSSLCAGRGPVHVVVLLSDPVAKGTDEVPERIRQHPESLPLDVAVFAWEGGSPSAAASPSSSASDAGPAPSIPVLSLAAVVGGPRERPHAKDSLWARARRPLERKLAEAVLSSAGAAGGGGAGEGAGSPRPPSAAAAGGARGEGLLVDARGRLLEGLVTNVFVVAEEGDGSGGDEGEAGGRASEGGRGGVAGGGAGGRSDLSRFSLHTASAASDGVLDGTMRRAVLEAADALGIPVVTSPPDPSERRRWREAFVTSALRGVAAVARVRGQGGGGPGGGEPWSVDFSREVPGRVTREIAEALPCVIRRHEVKL